MASCDSDDDHHRPSGGGTGKSNWRYTQAEIKKLHTHNKFGYISRSHFGKMIEANDKPGAGHIDTLHNFVFDGGLMEKVARGQIVHPRRGKEHQVDMAFDARRQIKYYKTKTNDFRDPAAERLPLAFTAVDAQERGPNYISGQKPLPPTDPEHQWATAIQNQSYLHGGAQVSQVPGRGPLQAPGSHAALGVVRFADSLSQTPQSPIQPSASGASNADHAKLESKVAQIDDRIASLRCVVQDSEHQLSGKEDELRAGEQVLSELQQQCADKLLEVQQVGGLYSDAREAYVEKHQLLQKLDGQAPSAANIREQVRAEMAAGTPAQRRGDIALALLDLGIIGSGDYLLAVEGETPADPAEPRRSNFNQWISAMVEPAPSGSSDDDSLYGSDNDADSNAAAEAKGAEAPADAEDLDADDSTRAMLARLDSLYAIDGGAAAEAEAKGVDAPANVPAPVHSPRRDAEPPRPDVDPPSVRIERETANRLGVAMERWTAQCQQITSQLDSLADKMKHSGAVYKVESAALQKLQEEQANATMQVDTLRAEITSLKEAIRTTQGDLDQATHRRRECLADVAQALSESGRQQHWGFETPAAGPAHVLAQPAGWNHNLLAEKSRGNSMLERAVESEWTEAEFNRLPPAIADGLIEIVDRRLAFICRTFAGTLNPELTRGLARHDGRNMYKQLMSLHFQPDWEKAKELKSLIENMQQGSATTEEFVQLFRYRCRFYRLYAPFRNGVREDLETPEMLRHLLIHNSAPRVREIILKIMDEEQAMSDLHGRPMTIPTGLIRARLERF